MYYLRKESYEGTLPEVKKTDGTVVLERKYMTEDRALYKENGISKLYRDTYPTPKNKGFKLYKVKNLRTIMEKRKELFDYCGEWFDVYDDDVKIKLNQ